MTALVVVPARGGSQGVPLKNLRRVGGVPLVGRAAAAALAAPAVDAVVVSTDHAGIAAAARDAGAEVVDRPVEISGPTATSESAVLHALDAWEARQPGGRRADVVVLVQPTSPFLRPEDLDAAVRSVEAGEADSVFSAVETHAFLWRETDAADGATGVNHDRAVRPRRQDLEPQLRETGAFYVMRADALRRTGHRFTGRVAVQRVPEAHSLEIDTEAELELAVALAGVLERPGPPAGLERVQAVVTDFDGVHTADDAWVDTHGVESVRVSRSDGMGVERLRRAGVPVLVLSKERDGVVARRAAKLGVEVLHGVERKAEVLARWMQESSLDPARVVYVGNDVNDLGPLALVGWPAAVADASPAVLAAARLRLSRPGGHGAVRELAELVLTAKEAQP